MSSLVKRWYLLHPILLAAYPVLFLWANNVGQVGFGDVIRPLLIVIGSAIVLTVVLARFTSSPPAAAMSISLFMVLFLSYGHVVDLIDGRWGVDPHQTVASVELLGLVIVLWWLWRRRNRLEGTTGVVNTVAAILILVQLGWGGWMTIARGETTDDAPISAGREQVVPSESHLPDIYYIIADGYARHDVLARVYGVDNTWFLDSLKGRGFHVSDSNHANYCQTVLSLASSLNMDYLSNMDQLDRNSYHRAKATARVQSNRLMQFVRERGYQTVTYETGYNVTDLETVDHYLSGGARITEFESVLMSTTPLAHLVPSVANPYDLHRRRSQFLLRNLGQPDDIPSPKFVFAHLIAPHPPFVFGANGESLTPSRTYSMKDGNDFRIKGGDSEEYLTGYRDQLEYVTGRLWEAIRRILDNADQPPIIVLQSDHGPGYGTHWQLVDLTDVQERLAILNCYHIPGLPDSALYTGITPVNSFRLVLNHLFEAGFPMLPDSSFYSPVRHAYDFIDVGERLRSAGTGISTSGN